MVRTLEFYILKLRASIQPYGRQSSWSKRSKALLWKLRAAEVQPSGR